MTFSELSPQISPTRHDDDDESLTRRVPFPFNIIT
jgi:hypothetical protein